MWPTATAPTGFLLCNGATANRITYAALFALIGVVYGVGDGSTTFNLPNFNNRSPIGAGGLYTAAQTLGSKDAITVSHTHTITDPGHVHSYLKFEPYTQTDSLSTPYGGRIFGATTQNTASTTTGITGTNSTGSSGTDANLQPSLGIFFIIKT
jgi:microcystin-dependent protein